MQVPEEDDAFGDHQAVLRLARALRRGLLLDAHALLGARRLVQPKWPLWVEHQNTTDEGSSGAIYFLLPQS